MLVQALDIELVLSLALASFVFLILVGSVYGWIIQIRKRRIRKLEQLLLSNMTMSVLELADKLDPKTIPIQSVIYAAQRASNAILNYSKTSVVSSTLLKRRLHNLLVDNSVVHIAKESAMWDISEVIIANYVEMISEEEGLDVVQTEDGDYILVPEFKERMREVLGLQGRINITSEAQRLHVKRFALVQLVERWGWNLIEMGDGFLVSVDWLKRTLERSMERTGYLEPGKEAARLAVSERDIVEAIRRFGWSVVHTTDDRLLPIHIIVDRLDSLLESVGYLNPSKEAERLHIDYDDVMKVVRRTGKKFYIDDQGTVLTHDYLRERILEDLALTGKLEVNEEADTLGVKVQVVSSILRSEDSARRIGRGTYLSISRFRQWLLDDILNDGIISVNAVEEEWGIPNHTLNILLKEFGIRTVTTRSGNHLSLSWARKNIAESLEKGESVDPANLVDSMDISFGAAQALLAQVDSDAIMNSAGALVPLSKLKREFTQIFSSKGVLDPAKEARERMLDPSDVRQIITSLSLDAIVGATGTLISMKTIFRLMRWALDKKGSYDLKTTAKRLNVEYSEILENVHNRLEESDYLLSKSGVIVTKEWIQDVRQKAEEIGSIPVTSFARNQGIRRGAMIEILRRFLKGAYIPRSDVYMISKIR